MMENSTPISTRALLLVLYNIESNAKLDIKPASEDSKSKMESIDSHIPKKPQKEGWTEKNCILCKKLGVHASVTIHVTTVATTKMSFLLKTGGGVPVYRFKGEAT